MTATDAAQFRKEAEECQRLADRAMSETERDAWLRLADDWTKLAEAAERGTIFSRR
ncbi:hypothetical protein QA640_30415 [Bradyrhizobium sp. CB82]|jgi:hypothetical protein|uniref:hypothetical protein n=1 Tax=Bradyrhizobium sp. CB82 TaxID=3039159 RepID=UPI0024B1FD5E|nr:hypothetical protein [Bradyrhizobium sp. CB82]WFU38710.1 hypothetical protein QA640_30415 [Bradyrhizobium sp. CB82]